MGEQLSTADLKKIIEKEKPRFMVLDLPEDDAPIGEGIDRTPELAELKRMWGVDISPRDEDVQVITLPDQGAGPKIQAIQNGEIVAQQG